MILVLVTISVFLYSFFILYFYFRIARGSGSVGMAISFHAQPCASHKLEMHAHFYSIKLAEQ